MCFLSLLASQGCQLPLVHGCGSLLLSSHLLCLSASRFPPRTPVITWTPLTGQDNLPSQDPIYSHLESPFCHVRSHHHRVLEHGHLWGFWFCTQTSDSIFSDGVWESAPWTTPGDYAARTPRAHLGEPLLPLSRLLFTGEWCHWQDKVLVSI